MDENIAMNNDTPATVPNAAVVERAARTIGSDEVDALFVTADNGRELITLNGADRAYRLFVEDMANGAVTLTTDGTVAWCNRSFAALLGRPLNRLIGTPADLCFAPEARQNLARLLAAGRRGKHSEAIDLLSDRGERVPVYLSVNPSVVDGVPEALCLVATDLTEQRRSAADQQSRQQLLAVIRDQQRTQQQLQASLAALSLRDRALGAISQGVLITDAARAVTYVNAAFEAMSGYTAAEMLGQSCSVLQGPQTDAQMVLAMRDAMSAQRPFHGEMLNYRKDGVTFWNDVSITPVLGIAGEPTQFVGVQRDITERMQAEQAMRVLGAQLRESQKMEAIGTLAGGIAHDFNNILGSMLGNAGLALHALAPGHAARPLLEQVNTAGHRARSLVEQILTFSRRQPTLLKALSLELIVREAVNLLSATLPATVRLEFAVQAGPPLMIMGDATQLQQIVINLCTNAWQALSGSSGRITVWISAAQVFAEKGSTGTVALPPGNYVHLSVSDNGNGMDAVTQARIFEPFFSTKASGSGTGLGLSVVHGIVASHHGHIAVRSRPGDGTTFDLHFPLTHNLQADASPPAALDGAVCGQGQRVLYIDDDEVMLIMVGRLLERLGYHATCLSDPAAAIAAVQARRGAFAAVVTDFNMPLLTGLDVARALREADPALPVAISSGFISDAMRAAAAEVGVFDLMRKEHTLEELGALLGRLLAKVAPA